MTTDQTTFDRATTGITDLVASLNTRLSKINQEMEDNYTLSIKYDSEQLLSRNDTTVIECTENPNNTVTQLLLQYRQSRALTRVQEADIQRKINEAHQLTKWKSTLTNAQDAVHTGTEEALAESLSTAINYLPFVQDLRNSLSSISNNINDLCGQYHDLPAISELAAFAEGSVNDIQEGISTAINDVASEFAAAGTDFVGSLITDFSGTLDKIFSSDGSDFSLDSLLPEFLESFPTSFSELWEKITSLAKMLYDMVMKTKVVTQVVKLHTNLQLYCALPPPPSAMEKTVLDTIKDYLQDIFDGFVNSGLLKILVKSIMSALFSRMLGHSNGSGSIASVSSSSYYTVGYSDVDTFLNSRTPPVKSASVPGYQDYGVADARKFYEVVAEKIVEIAPNTEPTIMKNFKFTESGYDILDATKYQPGFEWTPATKSTKKAAVLIPASYNIISALRETYYVKVGGMTGKFKSQLLTGQTYFELGVLDKSKTGATKCELYRKQSMVGAKDKLLQTWDIPRINKPCKCVGEKVTKTEDISPATKAKFNSYLQTFSKNIMAGVQFSTIQYVLLPYIPTGRTSIFSPTINTD